MCDTATNKSIPPLIDDGSFRDDLYYRLNIVPLRIPALRERREDIPLLAEHFLGHFCRRYDRSTKRFTTDAMQVLTAAQWPGNVRQLRNVMERLVVTVTGDELRVSDLPNELHRLTSLTAHNVCTLAEANEAAEKVAIQAALAASDCHREQTAKALGISVRSLHYKMSRYGLH